MTAMRMLIAHEWVSSVGGSEKVFRELLDTFPEASACCLWNDVPEAFDKEIAESYLASTGLRRRKPLALLAMPHAWSKVNLDAQDAVITSSHAFAHHLSGRAARAGMSAFAYVHTPARYLWAHDVEARGRGALARTAGMGLRPIDRRATSELVNYAANSRFIRDRIRESWGQDAKVIYPPVDVERISGHRWMDRLSWSEASQIEAGIGEPFILGASRLVEYKRLDLVLEAGELLGMPVVIAGTGPDHVRLRELARRKRVPVRFVGHVTDEQLFALYQEASLMVFLAVEDFGIMPVEAMASGTPVLVNRVGGTIESVAALQGGVAVDIGDMNEIAAGAEQAMTLDMSVARARASMFSRAAFRSSVSEWVAP